MAINLDELVANAGSVDDLMGALNQESAGATKTSAQLSQLYAAAEGLANSGSWLDKLKEAVSPKSVAGTIQYDQLYKKYYTDAIGSDEAPVSKEEFIKALEEHKAKGSKQSTRS